MIDKFLGDIRMIIQIHSRLLDAATKDESEDILVEKQSLRKVSIAASIIFSVIDIQTNYPLLFPLIAVSLALKFIS